MRDIAIIGGGASGLVAAITAARLGSNVTIFERQNRIGKKILVTGNGRCNMTNLNIKPEYFHTSSQERMLCTSSKEGRGNCISVL